MQALYASLTVAAARDRAEIDALVQAFFAAFSNKGGGKPRLDALATLFIPRAVIVKNLETPEVYSVPEFIAPREKLLTDGTLTDFEEAEIEGRTELFGNVAQRWSSYRKTGVLNGRAFTGRGMKSMQFVRTPEGWRLSAVAWGDVR
jgi:hypothetical protein